MGNNETMKPLKQKVSITLDENVVGNIKEIAEYYEYSLSGYINIVLKRHLKNAVNIKGYPFKDGN